MYGGDRKPKGARTTREWDEIFIRPVAGAVDLPVDRCAQIRGRSTAQSTGVHKRAQDSAHDSSVDRSVNRSRRMVDRPVNRLT